MFENYFLENGRKFFRQIFQICRDLVCPQKEILKLESPPNFGVWKVDFLISPAPRPWRRNYHVGRPGLDRTLDNRLHYTIAL